MKKRVLNIIGKRPTGGIGSFVYNYQSHFPDDAVGVDYLLFDDECSGEFDEKVRALGSNVYVLPALRNRRLLTLWKQVDRFMRDMSNEYSIVHLHSVNIAFMCLTSAKKYGIENLISHSHATVYSDKPLNALRNKVLCRNLSKQANIYLACSRLAGEFLYGKRMMDRVHVFNNAIECESYRFSQTRRDCVRGSFGWGNRTVIGHVGRFCEQKNQLFLLDVFKEYLKKDNDALLVLVGEGPKKTMALTKAKTLGVQESVIFLGQRNDVPDILQALDVLVLPSLFEGLPVVGIEAQASGLPVIASSAVTQELNIVGVEYIDLDASLDKWVEGILSAGNIKSRADACDAVIAAGFDINKEAKRLYDFYLSLE